MQRIHNLADWMLVASDKAINFENRKARDVRIEVNAPNAVSLYYTDTDGHEIFLARVIGRDTISFKVPGEFAICVYGGECWFRTVDGERIAMAHTDDRVFARIFERRARNPEVELMQHMMQQNMRRLMEQQTRELEELVNRRIEAARAAAPQPAPASDGAGAGGQPEPDGIGAAREGNSGADGGSGGAKK